MPINIDIFTPRTLGRLVQRIPKRSTFLINTFFTDETPHVTETIEVDFKKGNRRMAPFVHPVRGGKTIENEGYQTKSYKTPLLAPNKVTTAQDLLSRMAGENPYSGVTPADRAIKKLGDDFIELEDMIARRKEYMAASVIFGGKIPIIGEGLNEVIDFGFTNKEVLDGTTKKKWSNAASDPRADLKRWREKVQKTGFTNPNIVVFASDVADVFINHEKVKSVLDVRNYALGTIAPKQTQPGVTYIGTDHELGVDYYSYNEWYLDDFTDPSTPVELPLVPSGTVAMLSTEADFRTFYGAVTIIPEGSKEFETFDAQLVPQTWTERNPDRRIIQLNSRPLTAPMEVNSWYVATVL